MGGDESGYCEQRDRNSSPINFEFPEGINQKRQDENNAVDAEQYGQGPPEGKPGYPGAVLDPFVRNKNVVGK